MQLKGRILGEHAGCVKVWLKRGASVRQRVSRYAAGVEKGGVGEMKTILTAILLVNGVFLYAFIGFGLWILASKYSNLTGRTNGGMTLALLCY